MCTTIPTFSEPKTMTSTSTNTNTRLASPHWLTGLWPYLAIFVFALLIRCFYLFEIKDLPIITILLGDAESYDAWAQEIVNQGWIGERTFYQAPFYPYFLAAVYTLGARDFLLVKLVQALFGAASCSLLAGAGTHFFDKKTGLTAGLLLSLYAPAVFFDLLIQKAVLGLFFMSLLLFLISKTLDWETRGSRPVLWLLTGVVLACFALVRENALVLIPAILIWMVIFFWESGWKAIFSRGLLLFLGLTLIFMPVIFRNYVVGGEFILTTSQLGPNFYIGNNKEATGFYRPLIKDRSDWKFERTDAQALAEQDRGKTLTPNEVSDYWLDQSLEDIKNDPFRWLRLLGKKWALVWNSTETSDSESIYAHYRFSSLLNGLGVFFYFGVLLPLAVIGIALNWSQRKRFWGLIWIWLCFASSVALFFVFARYRHPMAAIMIIFASSGLIGLYRSIVLKQVKVLLVSLLVTIPFAIFANWPIVSKAEMEAPTHFNIGYELEKRNQLEAAKEAYLTSLSLQDNSLPFNNLGVVAMKEGRPEEAMGYFRRAVELDPANWDARVNLGIVLSQFGRKSEAIDQYKTVVRSEPDFNPALYYNIACYYSIEQRPYLALDWLKKAIEHGYSNWDLIRTDPDLDNVRQLPEFLELLD